MHGKIGQGPYIVVEHCPSNPHEAAYYTEVLFNGQLEIPCAKPDLEKVINVTREIYIEEITPITVKLDGGYDAGFKVLIRGFVRLGVEYSADIPEQTVHFAHFSIPFEGLIAGEPGQGPIPFNDCGFKDFDVKVCVERLIMDKIDARHVEEVIVLLLWLKRKDCSDESVHLHYECASPCTSPHVSTQIIINETFKVSPDYPPIEELLDSSLEFQFSRIEVMETPISALCGLPLRKVIVIGQAEVIIKYAAAEPNQQVFAQAYHLPIQGLVEWLGGPSQHAPVCLMPTQEFFEVEVLDPRHLFVVLILRLDVFRDQDTAEKFSQCRST